MSAFITDIDAQGQGKAKIFLAKKHRKDKSKKRDKTIWNRSASKLIIAKRAFTKSLPPENQIEFEYQNKAYVIYPERKITQEARRILGFEKKCFEEKFNRFFNIKFYFLWFRPKEDFEERGVDE